MSFASIVLDRYLRMSTRRRRMRTADLTTRRKTWYSHRFKPNNKKLNAIATLLLLPTRRLLPSIPKISPTGRSGERRGNPISSSSRPYSCLDYHRITNSTRSLALRNLKTCWQNAFASADCPRCTLVAYPSWRLRGAVDI